MDEPDFTTITIRNHEGHEREIAKHALPFWPGWERVDAAGRKVPAAPAGRSTEKES